MLLEQTRQYISGLSDEDLIQYWTSPGYQPEAIAFAQEEIARRNLVTESLEYSTTITSWRDREEKRERRIASYLPLPYRMKIISFVHGLLFIHGFFSLIRMSERFDKLGQKRRKQELWLFAFSGLAVFVLLILLVILSN